MGTEFWIFQILKFWIFQILNFYLSKIFDKFILTIENFWKCANRSPNLEIAHIWKVNRILYCIQLQFWCGFFWWYIDKIPIPKIWTFLIFFLPNWMHVYAKCSYEFIENMSFFSYGKGAKWCPNFEILNIWDTH